MNLSLAKILELAPLNRCRVVAGAAGLDRVITSINIADSPDPGPWVSKGQLVLTTGYFFKDDPQEQVRLLRQLAKQGCVGLAIKFDRFFPEPPASMVQEADLLRFPLIDIPYDMALSDLMSSIMKGILEYQHYQNYHEKLELFFTRLLEGELTKQEAILTEGRSLGLLPGRRYAMACGVSPLPAGSEQESDLGVMEDVFLKAGQLAGVRTIPVKSGSQFLCLFQFPPSKNPDGKTPWASVCDHIEEKSQQLALASSLFLGISGVKDNVEHLRAAYHEALEAIRIGRRVTLTSASPLRLYQYEELKPYTLLQSLGAEECRRYVESYLGILRQFDEKNGAELIKTLRCYLAHNGRSADCAQQLFVHRNTINFRLSRIEELLGVDLKDGETVFRLQLALKLLDLKFGRLDQK